MPTTTILLGIITRSSLCKAAKQFHWNCNSWSEIVRLFVPSAMDRLDYCVIIKVATTLWLFSSLLFLLLLLLGFCLFYWFRRTILDSAIDDQTSTHWQTGFSSIRDTLLNTSHISNCGACWLLVELIFQVWITTKNRDQNEKLLWMCRYAQGSDFNRRSWIGELKFFFHFFRINWIGASGHVSDLIGEHLNKQPHKHEIRIKIMFILVEHF